MAPWGKGPVRSEAETARAGDWGQAGSGLAESRSFGLCGCVMAPQAGSPLDTSPVPSEWGSPTQGHGFLASTARGDMHRRGHRGTELRTCPWSRSTSSAARLPLGPRQAGQVPAQPDPPGPGLPLLPHPTPSCSDLSTPSAVLQPPLPTGRCPPLSLLPQGTAAEQSWPQQQ